MSYIVVAFAFATGFLIVFGLNLILADYYQRQRSELRKRLDEDVRLIRRKKASVSLVDKDLYEMAAEGCIDLSSVETLSDRFKRFMDQAALSLTPTRLIIYSLITALLFGSVMGVAFRSWFVAGLASLLGSTVPILCAAFKRAQRREKLLSQLPDAFEMMSRVLRAGQTVPQSLQAVADESAAPLSEEFGYCWEQQNLGLSPEASLRELAHRTGLLEVKIFVVAMTVHRQTGGNLSELLDKLSTVIRERYRIRGQINALTAEGRFQAYVLLGLPLVMLVALSTLNPPYMATLYAHPWMLGGMFIFEAFGALWMRSIIKFDF